LLGLALALLVALGLNGLGPLDLRAVSCTVSGAAWVAFTRVGGRYRAEVTVHNPLYDG